MGSKTARLHKSNGQIVSNTSCHSKTNAASFRFRSRSKNALLSLILSVNPGRDSKPLVGGSSKLSE
jgi:hypothetical protein